MRYRGIEDVFNQDESGLHCLKFEHEKGQSKKEQSNNEKGHEHINNEKRHGRIK